MTELYLVRHGETNWNRQKRIQGLTDIPLNDTGRDQAEATGALLARRRWDAVVSSPLSRARETAQIIATVLGLDEPTVLDEIVERNYGAAEGLNWGQVERDFPRGTDVPGRESREQVSARVVPALIRLAERHPGQALVVVSHGGAIRAVLEEVEPSASHGMITNGSVHSFRLEDGALRLIAFDDPIEVESIGSGSGDLDEQNAVEAMEDGAG
ncbi:MAG: histidine phosphatase family protein [Acidobacteria bacterium]|nr:histidine phosphatase family protein [Acidobacteriota bacterium]